jgi:hypothetical protein
MSLVKDINPIGFRFQPGLKEWLKSEAKKNCRTMNTEMVFILENEKARRAGTQQALNESSTNAN